MAAAHNEQHTEDTSLIKTPKQLITVVVLAFVVPICIIVLLATLVMSKSRFDSDHPGMTDEAIAQRIKPVGDVILASATGAAAGGEEKAPAGAPAQAADLDGKAVYDKVCMACHATGVAGAPKTGDKAGWAPRIKQGMDALYAASLKGKGAMPPKGGGADLSDAQVKAAVDYLVGQAK